MAAPPERRCFVNAGQIYYGDVVNGADAEIVRHGQGLQITKGVTKDGEPIRLASYEGAWKKGRMTGSGVFRWSDGSCYEGAFRDGRLHGIGRLSWAEGSSYDGTWNEGEMTGQGRFDNSFDGIATEGIFCRNSIRQHDGTWVDVHKLRREHHAAWLRIGALGAGVEGDMPLHRCTPGGLGSIVSDVLQQNLVPLILADTTCPEAVPDAAATSDAVASASPLWCLQEGPRGCTPRSTVYIEFAALEKKRKRDYQQVFRNAIREALVEYHPFVLVFGAADEANPQDGEPLPPAWRLTEFFDPFCLPPHLFDLQHFHSSDGVEAFLPPEEKGASLRSAANASGPGLGGGSAEQDPSAAPTENAQPLPPPTVPVLRFSIVSLSRVEADLDDNAVRMRIGRQFAAHVPLHRMAIIVVGGE